MLKEKLESKFIEAIRKAIADSSLGELKACPDSVAIELPKNPDHGDRAVSIAMKLTKEAKIAPRNIAEAIKNNLELSGIEAVDIAGPGFINLKLDWSTLEDTVAEINKLAENYGSYNDANKPEPDIKSVLLEYVSANPTGDLHLGHGRQAVIGSALARLFEKAGYKVHNEFYINDAGAQMEKLGNSFYQFKYDQENYDHENNYPLDSVKEVVDQVFEDGFDSQDKMEISQQAKKVYLAQQQEILKTAKTEFQKWYSEKDNLHGEPSRVEAACQELLAKGMAYESEGALWFKAKEFGDERDRVLKKQDGKFTYLAADLAYHQDKLSRADHLINLWGADHHGQIAGMKGILEAAGADSSKLEVQLMQMVSLTKNGQEVKMSKRSGNFVTIADLVEEVGVDAFRYFLVENQASNRVVFDLELATKQDKDNPVYYIQYAHARCCSILRNMTENHEEAILTKAELATWQKDFQANQNLFAKVFANLNADESKSTRNLILFLAQYPDMIYDAALNRAPNKVANYLKELASLFHQFYTHNRVINDDKELVKARLSLVNATRIVLASGLDILAISAPERM